MKTRRSWMTAAASGLVLLSLSSTASALERCYARANTKGNFQVSARKVTGTLHWGWSPGLRNQPFHNPECVDEGTASGCMLAAPGTPLATTQSPDCMIYLKDDVSTCTAFLKNCTPGPRQGVELPPVAEGTGDTPTTDPATGAAAKP